MRMIVTIMAMIMATSVIAFAEDIELKPGELGVVVPFSEVKRMKTVADTLEIENRQLREQIRALNAGATGTVLGSEMSARLAEMENENRELQKQIDFLRAQGTPQTDTGAMTRIGDLERENRQLLQQIDSMQSQPAVQADPALQSRLSSLEQENSQLKQSLEAAQAGAGTAVAGEVSPADQDLFARVEEENRRLKLQVRNLKEGKSYIVSDMRTATQVYNSRRKLYSYDF